MTIAINRDQLYSSNLIKILFLIKFIDLDQSMPKENMKLSPEMM